MATSVTTYNPSSIWPVPEAFRTIYSHASETVAGARTLYISGQVGIAPDGALPAGFAEQAQIAMTNVEGLLAAADMSLANLVKLTFYLTRAEDGPALVEIRQARWGSATPPAVTALTVSALVRPELLIEIDAIAAA